MVGASRGMGSIPIANRFDFFHRIIGALRDLRKEPVRLALSFAATFLHWFLMGVTGWVLALGLEIDVDPLTMATVLVAATFFTSAMLSLPGGTGTYHFAVVSMLVALGADRALAFSFAFVMHLLVFVPPMLLALVVMTRLGSGAILRNRQPAAVFGGESPKRRPEDTPDEMRPS
jgi:uncharacterized membrane protein YbhN (UPF0104 family)